jgi:hypothetical protein
MHAHLAQSPRNLSCAPPNRRSAVVSMVVLISALLRPRLSLHTGVGRRLAGSLALRAARVARLARDPVRESELTLACEDDSELVFRFATKARKALGDAVLHGETVERLTTLCLKSAHGDLPFAAWGAALAELPRPPVPSASRAERKQRWDALLVALRARIAPGAHEVRPLASGSDRGSSPSSHALQQQPLADRTHAMAAALVLTRVVSTCATGWRAGGLLLPHRHC